MEVYASVEDPRMPIDQMPDYAKRVERCGFTGLLIPESIHDAFMTSLLALEHTRELRVASSVALAFPRSPMIVAYSAWDLQAMSGGRFDLGLGSQVKGNIVGRFAIAWHPPVPRMRDYIASLRAIWSAWQSGAALDFESAHYTFNKMQPFFAPPPLDGAPPRILLGGVNRNMTRLAGEAADGFMTHPTNTNPRYLGEVINPNLSKGCERSKRPLSEVERIGSTFIATAADDDGVRAERERLREYLAFVFSTPEYWPTLELLGWPDVGENLRQRTREGRWVEMKDVITDPLLDAIVPSGTYDKIVPIVFEWYRGELDAITLRMPDNPRDDPSFAEVVRALRAA